MPRKLLYIINPISGTRTKADLQDFIEKETRKRGLPYLVLPSVASGDYSFLYPIVKEEGITDVVIAGGDGTVSQVVNGLLDLDLRFGVIPCGSGNGLALAAGISKSPAKALSVVFDGRPRLIDGFSVNGQFACMLAGLGFDAKVAHEFAQQPKRGLATYASLVSRNFFSAKPYEFIIENNGLRFPSEAYFISIANSNQFGNNVTIAPEALLSDGKLDVVIVKKTAKPMLLFNLIKQVLGGKLKGLESSLNQPIIYFQTESLLIINKDQAPMHIDGDPADTPDELQIKVLPGCFRLICPLAQV